MPDNMGLQIEPIHAVVAGLAQFMAAAQIEKSCVDEHRFFTGLYFN